MTVDQLPTHEACAEACAVNGAEPTALQRFIDNEEPAGKEHEALFRQGPADVITEAEEDVVLKLALNATCQRACMKAGGSWPRTCPVCKLGGECVFQLPQQ